MSHLSDERLDAVAGGGPESSETAHLDACAQCKAAVASARGRQRLLSGLTPYTLSEVGFGRVEAKLLEAVDAGETQPRFNWAWVLAPLALAALALVLWLPSPAPAPATSVAVAPAPKAVQAKVEAVPLTVLANLGHAKARAGEAAWRELAAGEVLSGELALSGGPLRLAAAAGPALGLEIHGTAVLAGAQTAALGAGRLVLRTERPTSVEAGGCTLEAVSATYAVSVAAAEVVVDVSAGEVVAADADGATRRVLKAPVRARWPLSASVSTARVDEAPEPVRLASTRPPFVSVDFSGLPQGTALTVDGVPFGVAPVVALLSEGKHQLLSAPPGKPQTARWLDLVAGHPFTVPSVQVEAEASNQEPEPEALSRLYGEVRGQVPKLRACYEKWLKANPDASGEVQLVLSVTAKGKVRGAKVEGDAIAPGPADCLVRTAKTLVLSPLGVDQDVAVPLVMRPKAK